MLKKLKNISIIASLIQLAFLAVAILFVWLWLKIDYSGWFILWAYIAIFSIHTIGNFGDAISKLYKTSPVNNREVHRPNTFNLADDIKRFTEEQKN